MLEKILRVFDWIIDIDGIVNGTIYTFTEPLVLDIVKQNSGFDFHGIVKQATEKDARFDSEEIGETLQRLSYKNLLFMRMEGNPFREGKNKEMYSMRYYVRK